MDALIERLTRHFAAAGAEGRIHSAAMPTLLKYAAGVERSPYETMVSVLADHADVGERLPVVAVAGISGSVLNDTHSARVMGTFRWPPRLEVFMSPGATPTPASTARTVWSLPWEGPTDLTVLGVTWTFSDLRYYGAPDELRDVVTTYVEGGTLFVEALTPDDFELTATVGTPVRISGPTVGPEVLALREAPLDLDGVEEAGATQILRLALAGIDDEDDLRGSIENRSRFYAMRGPYILSRRAGREDIPRALEVAPPRAEDLSTTAAAVWRLAETGTGGFEAGATLSGGGVLDTGVRAPGPADIDAAGDMGPRPLYVVFASGDVWRTVDVTPLGTGRYQFGALARDPLSASSLTGAEEDLFVDQPSWWMPQRSSTYDRGAFRRYELKADLSIQVTVLAASSNERRELGDLVLSLFGFAMEPQRFSMVGRGTNDLRYPGEDWVSTLNARISDGGRQEFPRPGSDAEKVHARRITIPLLHFQYIDRELTWSGDNPSSPPTGTPIRIRSADVSVAPGVEPLLVRPSATVRGFPDPTIYQID